MNWEPLLLSFEVAGIASLFTAVIGVTIALMLARARFPGSDVVDVIVTAPMLLPPTVLGYYLLVIVGRNSTIGASFEAFTGTSIVFTKTGAILAATISALPFVVKSARAAIEEVDERLIGAARTLGAGSLRIYLTIVLPLARNGIIAGIAIGFARALGDFGITLMVAGNIPGLTQTGALAIYDAVQAGRDHQALGMASMMALLAMTVLYAVIKFTPRKRHGW